MSMVTNLLLIDSGITSSHDLWWVEDPGAVKGYNVYRAFDHPSNWQRIAANWRGHFYRDMTTLMQTTYTVKPEDFIEKGETGQWVIRLPETPYTTVKSGRVTVSNSPDDVQIVTDGVVRRPTSVNSFDRTVTMLVDNTLAPGGAVSDTAQANTGNVNVTDYNGVQVWQAVFNKLTNYVDIYASFNRTYYCYSDDTEVFTKDGWKLFQECQKDDLFATRKIQTKEFEWQQADGFFKARYDGDLVHVHGQSLDQLVTPNHRMLVNSLPDRISSRKRPRNKQEHVIEAASLAGASSTNTGIATTSVWTGKEIQEKVFGGKRRRIFGPVPRKIVLTGDDFCAFMGMYLAEGSVLHNNKGFTISQPCDVRGSRELYAALLTRLFGGCVTLDDRGLVVHSVAMGEYLRQFGHAHEKFVPEEIREATPRQLEVFWKYYYAGDGAANGDGSGTQQTFTVSRRLADHLTEIVQKMGSSSTTYIKLAGEDEIQGRRISCRQGYFVSRHTRKSGYTANWKIENVEYHGDVFCVSVPNMFLYVRRNGKACWSGNTVVPIGEKGELHKPGEKGTDVRNTQEIDKIDWVYEEMVRRNEYLFQTTGEPALCFFRMWRGEQCGCVFGSQQPKTGCPVCFETGFVGGYIGPYDFLFVPPDSALNRILDEGGIKTTRTSRSYMTRTPIVQNGDLILRANGDIMVISDVVYKMPRGIILQQDFTVELLAPGDTRYLSAQAMIRKNYSSLPTLYNPVVRPDPEDGKGTGQPVFDPRTVPAIPGGKDWENPNIPVGKTVTFAKIVT
jgi:hypothetical protein